MTMHKPIWILVVGLGACALHKQRTPQTYRVDTQTTLETRNAQIKSCYDDQLKSDAASGGMMTVRFVVKKKTGVFTSVALDPEKSQAPEPLARCVVNALEGLKLEPPDANDGHATFVYQLRPAAPPSS
jgi:hypothetical protein